MLSLESYVCRSETAAFRVLDGVSMIIDPAESKLYALNRVGTRIWELADGKRHVSRIIEMICARFDVERAQATKDAVEFIEELSKKGLLVVPKVSAEEE